MRVAFGQLDVVGPSEFDAVSVEALLKCFEIVTLLMNGARCRLMFKAERGERAGGFANVPFDRMKTVTTVRDVRCANVLARGQQVLQADRNQRAERDLKRQ